MKQIKEILTRKEAATLLGVSLPTLWDWTRKGMLKSYRLGGRIYYKHEEIQEALQEVE